MNNRNYKDLKMRVAEARRFSNVLTLLILESSEGMPDMKPGQFVNVLAPRRANVLLRRPISICNVEKETGRLWLLVKNMGRGSGALCECYVGEEICVEVPLGHGFSIDIEPGARILLVGGGVGIAPLLYLGKILYEKGFTPEFLLGGRTADDLPLLDEFKKIGSLHIATEDGSLGIKGMVTAHERFSASSDMIYCCGPLPMMKAVATAANARGIACEVSLENKMACGIGACLCCVEDTRTGNRCTCTDGPVFNIKDLTWNQ